MKSTKKFTLNQVLLRILLPISLCFNFVLFKIEKLNFFSPEQFQIIIAPNNTNAKKEALPKKFDTLYNTAKTNFCGSSGCIFKIKDRKGVTLLEDLAADKPVWIEATTEGQKDLLVSYRTYPATGYARLIRNCFNQKSYTYSPENCAGQSFDSLFTSIDVLPALTKKFIQDVFLIWQRNSPKSSGLLR